MSSAFRRRSDPAPPEESIPDDLLASIPDVAPGADALGGFDETHDAASPAALHNLVLEMRAQMEATVARELDRVEHSFSGLVETLEARLAQAQVRLDALQRENDALQRKEAAYQQRFARLRELTTDLDRP